MKETIVFWGTNENDLKIMTILRLRAVDKKVDVWTFEKDKLNDDFVEKMFDDWKSIDPESFPEHSSYEERDVTEGELLPETIRADKTELIIRTEQDWRFKVLSIRVAEMLKNEISALHEQIETAESYDKDLWETSKSYNAKLMSHAKERTLAYDQINGLRSVLNSCFEKLKALMAKNNEQYEQEAGANKKMAVEKINTILAKARDSKQGGPAFEELKKVQNYVKDIRLTKGGRKEIWNLLNASFTEVKSMKKSQAGNRLTARITGLEKAINKMQKSVDMDQESVDFQNRKAGHINASKLEMQLREAKIKMIASRIESKQAKLDDMHATMAKLKKQLGNQEAKTKKAEAKKTEEKKPDNKQTEAKKEEVKKAESAKAPAETPAETPAENKAEAPKENTVVAPVVEPKVEEPKAEEPKVNEQAENEAATQAEEQEESAEKSEEEVELKTEADVKPEKPDNGAGEPAENEEKPVPPVVTEDTQVAPQATETEENVILHDPKVPEDEEE